MSDTHSDVQAVSELGAARRRIEAEVGKVIVGQSEVLEQILICLFANGHCIIIGVPGLAKTLMVNTVARVLELDFNRVQFTPDLMPADITGTEILEEEAGSATRKFRFIRGPVFNNVVLADEINRTPPKTQSALLQAMQEYKVTVSGQTYPLPLPFFVLATQNPIEQEGTYPLPEAQLDRFMFSILIDYPQAAEEEQIVKATTSAYAPDLKPVLSGSRILELQRLLRRVPVADEVVKFAVKLASLSRPKSDAAPKFAKDWISWGAGPRASQYLILGAKTRAILDGRFTPAIDDVRAIAPPVLRHRIVTNFNAEADGVTPDDVVRRLLESA